MSGYTEKQIQNDILALYKAEEDARFDDEDRALIRAAKDDLLDMYKEAADNGGMPTRARFDKRMEALAAMSKTIDFAQAPPVLKRLGALLTQKQLAMGQLLGGITVTPTKTAPSSSAVADDHALVREQAAQATRELAMQEAAEAEAAQAAERDRLAKLAADRAVWEQRRAQLLHEQQRIALRARQQQASMSAATAMSPPTLVGAAKPPAPPSPVAWTDGGPAEESPLLGTQMPPQDAAGVPAHDAPRLGRGQEATHERPPQPSPSASVPSTSQPTGASNESGMPEGTEGAERTETERLPELSPLALE